MTSGDPFRLWESAKFMATEKGQVIKTVGSNSVVLTDNGRRINCTLTGKYRLEDLKSTNPVVVGDKVRFEFLPGLDKGRIIEVFDRKNYIIRRASNLSKTYQIIASNIDQLFLLVTVTHPVTYTEFIDRYLVTAEAYNIPAILLFNKIDLYTEEESARMNELISIYEDIPYRCIPLSALCKTNLLPVQQLMKDKLNIFSGVSGTGKSTLINSLDERLHIKTRELSEYHKAGRHTTTFGEMYQLSFNAYVIDTPGIKGFGIIDMDKEPISHYFPEIFRASRACRYHNCNHLNEPGCAILEALQEGSISLSRYTSYKSLLEEQNKRSKYRR
jgi:ribosome biogenesis GTPase